MSRSRESRPRGSRKTADKNNLRQTRANFRISNNYHGAHWIRPLSSFTLLSLLSVNIMLLLDCREADIGGVKMMIDQVNNQICPHHTFM